MVTGLREFLETKWGKGIAAALILVGAIAIFQSFRSNLGQSEAEAASRSRMFVCSQSGESFEATVSEGMTIPVHSPHSGENTGYPAELCYWTADGTIEEEPTYVLLNKYANKDGPTFCPTCHRIVVQGNPLPVAGYAPQTEAEYNQQRSGRAE